MIIKTLEALQFTSWEAGHVDLPETGVVVVTGLNGAGKSTMIEIVAHAVFGKSVRGSWGWRDPPAAAARGWTSGAYVETDRMRVHRRRRSSGSPELATFDVADVDQGVSVWVPQAYDTTSKAQGAIEAIVGPFDVWERCHVFSSHDAVHFTLATDKDRKRLLEGLLGLDYFDVARERATALASRAENELAFARDALERTRALITHQQSVITQADTVLNTELPPRELLVEPIEPVLPSRPTLPDPPPLPDPPAPIPPLGPAPDMAPEPVEVTEKRATILRVQDMLATARVDLAQASDVVSTEGQAIVRLHEQIKQVNLELAGWDTGTCPTCTQPVDAALREQLVGPAFAKRDAIIAEGKATRARLDNATAQENELAAELDALDMRLNALRDAVQAYDVKRTEQIEQRAQIEQRHAEAVAAREREHAQALRQHSADHKAACDRILDRWTAQCSQLRAVYEAQRDAYTRAVAERAVADVQAVSQRAQWEHQRQQAEAAIATLQGELAKHEADCHVAHEKTRRIVMVKDVLGPKGVRAHILGGAMGGLQTVANTWLSRIGTAGQAVQLAEEGAALALSLRSDRRPTWHPYKAASGGERRRVDVALILALAEVSRAARGKARGTMFFDEVFDALDPPGVDAVSDVLDELGADRCVVVITHNMLLAQRLNAALRLHVQDGTIA